MTEVLRFTMLNAMEMKCTLLLATISEHCCNIHIE